jgi:serine/threonine protein phosphatase PrpC
METRLACAGRSEAGRRKGNEDAFCAEPELGLFAVADGVGGYEGGEVASRLAIDTLLEFFRRNQATPEATGRGKRDPQRTFANCSRLGDAAGGRGDHAAQAGTARRDGSTIAGLAIRGGRAAIGHLGEAASTGCEVARCRR